MVDELSHPLFLGAHGVMKLNDFFNGIQNCIFIHSMENTAANPWMRAAFTADIQVKPYFTGINANIRCLDTGTA